MKIKSSFGHSEIVSLKEILTRKYTNHKITSEQLFNLSAQPPNTCPIIDKAKNSIKFEIDRAKGCLKDLEYWGNRFCSEEECCNNFNLYEENTRLISDYSSNLDDIISGLTEVNEMLELLRSDAEQLRNMGNSLKDGIWSVISNRDNMEEVKEELQNYLTKGVESKENFDYHQLVKVFKSLDNSTPRLDEDYCKTRCEAYSKNNQLIEAFGNISSVDVSMPSEIDEAISNKDKIYYWVDELLDYLKTLINDEQLIEFNLEEEKRNYLQALNNSQVDQFAKFIKNLHLNPIKLVDKNKIPESYKQQEENLLVLKEIEISIDKINELITKYNSLHLIFKEESYLTAEVYLKDLHTRMNKIEANWDKALYSIQENFRSSKIQILKMLENVSPQFFFEEV